MRDHQPLNQRQIDWFIARGVSTDNLVQPDALLSTTDAVYIPEDDAHWNPRTGQVLAEGFCLGEHLLDDPEFHYPPRSLRLYATPLDWLRGGRLTGIYVLKWSALFDRLGHYRSLSVQEPVHSQYRLHINPPRLPVVSVFA